jgi:hypothetical protein
MATVQAQGGAAVTLTSTNNRGGSFVGGGSTTSATMEVVRSNATNISGQQFTVSATIGAAKALSGGPLSSMTKGKYVIRRYCTELATVANTTLQSGAAQPGLLRSINAVVNARASGFMSAYTLTGGDGMTVSYTTSTTNTTDFETINSGETAIPTRAVPGEFVYKGGAANPVQANYPARTNG